MAIQDIKTYKYQDVFSLQTVQFEKACVVNKPEQINTYKIFWIKEGKGTYHIDFETYSFDGSVLFFLSPGQIFSVDSEKIKEAYQLSFVQDFYCIQTHDKEVVMQRGTLSIISMKPHLLSHVTRKMWLKLDFIIE